MDSAVLSSLDEKIDQARGTEVVLDLGELTHVDGAAWLPVLACERRVLDWGRTLRLANAFGANRAMFESKETEHLLPSADRR